MNSTLQPHHLRRDGWTKKQPEPEVCEVRVLRSNAEIEEVREVWMGWQDNLNADIDFYLLINRLRERVVRPHVILVLSGGRPQAMALGRIEQGSMKIKFGYKSIGQFPVRTLTLVFGGLLGEHTPEATAAILASLQQSLRNGEAEVLTLEAIRADAELVKQLVEKVPFYCRDHFSAKRLHWRMTLGCAREVMYARWSPHRRQMLRKKARNFEKHFPGGLAIRCFREPAELDQMTADVEKVAQTTYQRGLGVGFIDNEENRTRLRFEARQGWLRVWVLYVKGKPCAYCWGTLYHNTFYCSAHGYDAQHAKYSPGIYLITKALEDLCQQGVMGFDFGLGDAHYKRQFGNERWFETFINVCPPRPRLIALTLINSMNNALTAATLAIAGRFHAVEIIKKRWRAKLAPRTANTPINAEEMPQAS